MEKPEGLDGRDMGSRDSSPRVTRGRGDLLNFQLAIDARDCSKKKKKCFMCGRAGPDRQSDTTLVQCAQNWSFLRQ